MYTVTKFRNGTIFPYVLRNGQRTVAMFEDEQMADGVAAFLNGEACEDVYSLGYDDGIAAVIENPSEYLEGRWNY